MLDRIGEAEAKTSGFDRGVRADLLIVIDQLDELFSGQVSEAERARFTKLLAQLVATGRVWVITTLRADLYERFLKEPELLAMKSKGATYDLAPPGATEIDEIIRGPATAAGLVYETDAKTGERLDDRLIGDVDRPDMLPLLQFTLNFLFEQRVTENGETRLTLKAYDTLGGLAGAIDREGERTVCNLGKEEQERLPRLLRQLAAPAQVAEGAAPGVGTTLAILSVPLAEAAYDPQAERLTRALVDARLLLSSGSEQNATIRLAHQRVLENWKRAKAIVAANAEFYRIRDDVEALKRRWEKTSKKRDLLIPKGVALAEAESIAKRYPGELSPPTLGFIAASGKRARLRQRLVAASSVVFAVLAVGATVSGIYAWQAEQRATRNFDVAGALVVDIARGLRNDVGVQRESRQKIFDQVSTTLGAAVAKAPDDEQLLGMQATMWDEFAQTQSAAGESEQAAQSKVKGLEIRLQLSEMSKDNEKSQETSQTLETLGDLKIGAGDQSGALAVYEKILAERRELAAADASPAHLRDLAAALLKVAQLKSRDPAGALPLLNESHDITAGLAAKDAANPELKRDLVHTLNAIGSAKVDLGDPAAGIEVYGKSLDIARALTLADKSNADWQKELAATLTQRGNAKLARGDNVGAIADFNESIALRRTLLTKTPDDTGLQRDVAANLSGVGDAQAASGDNKKALAAQEESADIQRKLAKADPNNIAWQRDLSIILSRIGDVKHAAGDSAGAIASYEDSLAIRRRVVEADPDNAKLLADEAYVLQRIGDVKRETGDNKGAVAAFAEDVEIARKLADADTGNNDLRGDLAAALVKLGLAKRTDGDNSGGLAALEEALAIRKALPKTDAIQWQLNVEQNLLQIGDLKLSTGDKDGGLAAYSEMLGLARAMLASNPNEVSWHWNVALGLTSFGDAQLAAGDTKGALASYQECLGIRRHLVEIDDKPERVEDLSLTLDKIGDTERATGDNQGALAAYEEMLKIDRKLAVADAANATVKARIAVTLLKLGDTKLAAKDKEGTLAAYEETLAIRRGLADADKTRYAPQWDVALTLEKIADLKRDNGDQAAAITTYAEAIDICRRIGEAFVGFDNNADALTVYEEAVAMARRVSNTDASNVDYQYNVSVNLEDLAATKLRSGDKAGSLADYEEKSRHPASPRRRGQRW